MKVKMYIDWENQKLYTEADYEKAIEAEMDELKEWEYTFEDFLNEKFTTSEIFCMSCVEKTAIECAYFKNLREEAEAALADRCEVAIVTV
jgi:hypothetical protein